MEINDDEAQDMQPRDYAEPRQVIIENGRVDAFMKALMTIGTGLVLASLLWIMTTLNSLNHQVTILVERDDMKQADHIRYENRLTELERQKREAK